VTQQVNSISGTNARTEVETHGETEASLGKISRVYSEKEFRNGLISAVQIATTYQEDVDKKEHKCKTCGIITNKCHSKVTPEELSHKWSVGLHTVKDTLRVTTQGYSDGDTSHDLKS
jgi:hypothetical protein